MLSAKRILIIEDDADINNIVATFLTKHGAQCTQAYSGSEANLLLSTMADASENRSQFDLIITDLALPGLTGDQLVAVIRSKNDTPIIVVSAKDAPAEKLALFGLGVDDYLIKPFDLEELLARVLVQLRHVSKRSDNTEISRYHLSHDQNSTLVFKDWEINPDSRQFSVRGKSVKVTRTEFNILEALMRRPSKVYTKQELFEIAWQEESFVEEKAINVHVSNIRSKLKSTETDSYIETVWGIGFKLAD